MKSILTALLMVFLWVTTAVAAVNINTATLQQLEGLPGIGPSKAEAIIQYREEHGPFQRVEDLIEVKGIGQKSFENIRSLIDVKKE